MTRCRSCDALLRWAKTAAGRRMPLDPEPHPEGNIRLGWIGGEEVAITLTTADIAGCQVDGLPLYRSHFATCPNAAEHRRASSPVPRPGPLQEAGDQSDA